MIIFYKSLIISKFTTMEFLVITTIVLILTELNVFFKIKTIFYKAHEYKKPFDCFFCLSVWANFIGLIVYFVITKEILLQEFSLSILISKIIDLQWNKN